MTGRTTTVNLWNVQLICMIFLNYAFMFWGRWIFVIFMAFIALISINARTTHSVTRDYKHTVPFVLVILWAFISVGWSAIPSESALNLFYHAPLFYTTYLIVTKLNIEDEKVLKYILAALTLSGWTIAFYLLARYGGLRFQFAYQVQGNEGNFANIIATSIAFGMPFLILLAGKTNLLPTAAIIIVNIAVIYLCQSRGAALVFLLSIPLSLSLKYRLRLSTLMIGILGAALFGLIGYIMLVNSDSEFALRLRTGIESVSSLAKYDASTLIKDDVEEYSRKMQMLFTIERIKEFPIFGLGFYGFKTAFLDAYGIEEVGHSLFAVFFVELGVVGFALYLYFFVGTILKLVKKMNTSQNKNVTKITGLALSLFILTNISFLFRPQFSDVTYFISVGFALAAIRPVSSTRRKKV